MCAWGSIRICGASDEACPYASSLACTGRRLLAEEEAEWLESLDVKKRKLLQLGPGGIQSLGSIIAELLPWPIGSIADLLESF